MRLVLDTIGGTRQAARLTLQLLLENVTTIPSSEYRKKMGVAEELTRAVDPDDAPFVALALASSCPLWTQDKALTNAPGIPTITTAEIALLIRDDPGPPEG